ncbi:RES domain-containing protein [Cereibacter sphaeroides]|uniref:RES domain-containing protein n=2 Tax=Cereibacter TaxID=1653176 RepID=A0AAX1UK41_CERSP|nr:hypothetical protein A9O63_21505 [Cereibacter johrii]RAZ84242.1 RES domain-containing protein [Cereibacter johrii]RHZ94246.1 RES domain-containing protein [Cereibacter sphaeroides]
MSLPTWTPDALRSEASGLSGLAWRLVEAQHQVSTMKLVDGAEQDILEAILDETKPPVPEECRHLGYLLSTPFRYRPYPHGSRFRRAGLTPGVWYGAEAPETAVAEMVFYRFLFYAESPATPFPDNAAEYTAFSVKVATPLSLDLTSGKLARDAMHWTHLTDYAPCQELADTARATGVEVIRYRSVRDPAEGANLAVLTCHAFAARDHAERQTWHIRIGSGGAQVRREFPRHRMEFPTNSFDADARLHRMNWDRPSVQR